MTQPKRCKDCRERGAPLTRPAPFPGPRCATDWRAEKKRRKDAAHDLMVQRVYGLKPGQYKKLYDAQGGKCAICRRAKGIAKRLSVDHDHACCPGKTSCGKCVRGLLCTRCNDMFGHARDDPEFFTRAGSYLSLPPARILITDDSP